MRPSVGHPLPLQDDIGISGVTWCEALLMCCYCVANVSVSERDDTGMSDLVKGLAQALFIVVCKNITEGGGADQKSAPERPHGRVVPYCGLVCIYVYISYMYINIYIVTII